jgi:hypothetical protein
MEESGKDQKYLVDIRLNQAIQALQQSSQGMRLDTTLILSQMEGPMDIRERETILVWEEKMILQAWQQCFFQMMSLLRRSLNFSLCQNDLNKEELRFLSMKSFQQSFLRNT